MASAFETGTLPIRLCLQRPKVEESNSTPLGAHLDSNQVADLSAVPSYIGGWRIRTSGAVTPSHFPSVRNKPLCQSPIEKCPKRESNPQYILDLNQATLPICPPGQKQYTQLDLNQYSTAPQAVASAKLGYGCKAVLKAGIEPARCCHHRFLRPTRLPISPLEHYPTDGNRTHISAFTALRPRPLDDRRYV